MEVSADREEEELEIKSILLLDDDLELANSVKALLETRNYVVSTVTNGADGLREIMQIDFDVIICDMLMPGMAGDMFYLAVQRTKPELCDRFIFLTGYQDNPKVTSFLQEIDALVLYKPVPIVDLVHHISLVLNRIRAKKKLSS